MKKSYIIIGVIVIILLVGIIIWGMPNKEYLHELNYKELKEKIEKKDSFILYIKQDTCSHCQVFTPIFKDVLNSYEIDAYYIRLNTFNDNERTINDDKSVSIINTDINFTGTPTVLFIENGNSSVMNRIVGSVNRNTVVNKLKTNGYIK